MSSYNSPRDYDHLSPDELRKLERQTRYQVSDKPGWQCSVSDCEARKDPGDIYCRKCSERIEAWRRS